MDIKREDKGNVLELKVEGRLDAYWADHLSQEISSAIREGRYSIALNLSGLTYISSAGIRVLMKFRQQLHALDGMLSVVSPSEAVAEVLGLMQLDKLFAAQPGAKKEEAARKPEEKRVIELPNATLEVYTEDAKASLRCRAVGDPGALPRCGFDKSACRSMSFPKNAFAVGLGALGSGFDDCRSRFGEFIAVAGGVAYQPTDRGNVPDYLISAERGISELQVLYCLSCEGGFSHLVTFDSKAEQSVSLLDIASQSLEIAGADAVGIVMAAEAVGLVGAALRRSPAMAEKMGTDLTSGLSPFFRHPEIRDWMTFTSEAAYARGVALVAGVISRKRNEALDPMVRPMGESDPPKGHWPKGHCHAAAFSYRPLRRGRVRLGETVRALFEEEALEGILHLINDTRPIDGAGQSEFVRGTCWVGPIARIDKEE